MKTIATNLGPSALQSPGGSAFEVTAAEWGQIDGYASKIAALDEGASARLSALVPALPTLRASAVTWTRETFPAIRTLGRNVAQYGGVTVQREYAALAAVLQDLETGHPSDTSRQAFANAIQTLRSEAAANVATASTIDSQVKAFTAAIEDAQRQAGSRRVGPAAAAVGGIDLPGQIRALLASVVQTLLQLVALTQQLSHPPLEEIQRIRGGLEAIAQDIDYVGAAINAEIASGQPFIADLDIDVARSAWEKLAKEANAFAGSVGG